MGFLSKTWVYEQMTQAERDQLMLDNVSLGYHPDSKDVFFLPDADRFMGTYVIGQPGIGKSSLLQSLIETDVLVGRAVIVVDPHGDLIDECLAQLPSHRVAHAYVLDMTDEAYPFGVNLFTHGAINTEAERTQVIDRITHVFDELWPEVQRQQNLPMYIRMAILALLATPGATLVDLLNFLLEDDFRAAILRHPGVDSSVRQWWRNEYDALKPEARKQRVQALLNRLYSLFMGRSLVRNIIGQRRTTISFRRAIENREIIFVRLPLKTLKQDAALIGMIIVAQIHTALFSFSDTPHALRPGFSLYIDEFQHFVTKDIEEMFTEGRKFRVRLTVAHQFRAQVSDEDVRKATLAANTKIAFRLNAEDGKELAPYFPSPTVEVTPDDAVEKQLRTHASDYPPAVQVFARTYLMGVQPNIRGKRVFLGERLTRSLSDGVHREDHWEANPTPLLNDLLYRCMRSGRADYPIPWEVAIGFSNCGRGFTNAIKRKDDTRLLPGAEFSPAQRPRNAQQRLIHFLFHLRATMTYLAEHPIGAANQTGQALVAQWLTMLPRRAAFVRSGDDVGVIYTHDTPARVSGAELSQRLARIKAQTRAKYCHPREQVQQLLTAEFEPVTATTTPVMRGQSISGWGEMFEP